MSGPEAFWVKGVIDPDELDRVLVPAKCHKYMDQTELPVDIGYHEHIGWFVALQCGRGPTLLWHSRDLSAELQERNRKAAEKIKRDIQTTQAQGLLF